jgi:hypothetical protein
MHPFAVVIYLKSPSAFVKSTRHPLVVENKYKQVPGIYSFDPELFCIHGTVQVAEKLIKINKEIILVQK